MQACKQYKSLLACMSVLSRCQSRQTYRCEDCAYIFFRLDVLVLIRLGLETLVPFRNEVNHILKADYTLLASQEYIGD